MLKGTAHNDQLINAQLNMNREMYIIYKLHTWTCHNLLLETQFKNISATRWCVQRWDLIVHCVLTENTCLQFILLRGKKITRNLEIYIALVVLTCSYNSFLSLVLAPVLSSTKLLNVRRYGTWKAFARQRSLHLSATDN